MSHNEKKLFRPLLVVVFSLTAALIFAFGRAPVLYVGSGGTSIPTPIVGPPVSGRANQDDVSAVDGSTGISGSVSQRNFRRDHDMTVEMISVGPEGFAPATLTRPSGRFLLAINNRSGLKELTFQLLREDGMLIQEARLNPKQPNWRSLVNLPPGRYRLTETSHADWLCTIVMTTQR
jgi:hypothetical protein